MEAFDEQHGYDEAASAADEPGSHVLASKPMLATVGRLRAFAVLLCLDADIADRLVATTLLRVCVAIRPSTIGPNLTNWLFSRLRQYYYHEYAGRSAAPAARRAPQSHHALHADLLAALAELTTEEREVLVLVEGAGCSAREAARICRLTPVQLRHRLERARERLAGSLSKPSGRLRIAPSLSATLLTLSRRSADIGPHLPHPSAQKKDRWLNGHRSS